MTTTTHTPHTIAECLAYIGAPGLAFIHHPTKEWKDKLNRLSTLQEAAELRDHYLAGDTSEEYKKYGWPAPDYAAWDAFLAKIADGSIAKEIDFREECRYRTPGRVYEVLCAHNVDLLVVLATTSDPLDVWFYMHHYSDPDLSEQHLRDACHKIISTAYYNLVDRIVPPTPDTAKATMDTHTIVYVETYDQDCHEWERSQTWCLGKRWFDNTPSMPQVIMMFANRFAAEDLKKYIDEGDVERYRISIHDATRPICYGECLLVDYAEIDDTTLYDYLTNPDHAAERENYERNLYTRKD